MLFERILKPEVLESIENFPVTAIVGPRQCGKSTLAKQIMQNHPNAIYLDLERLSDMQKLNNAEWFLSSQKGKLICIDEIQRSPNLFPLIRSLVDEWNYNGAFLILGSASRDLLKQSSETLAGRINYLHLYPFIFSELKDNYGIEQYYVVGGFPRSVLAKSAKASQQWRQSFISTFLERDLLQWRYFTPATMHRLWQMLAHNNGQTVDYSKYATSLGVSNQTVKNYIDLLASTFMIEIIPPYISNFGKRLVQSPRVYVADSGITTSLLGLKSFEEISGHSIFGSIWEQIVIHHLKVNYPNIELFFYRTSAGAEIDIVAKIDNKIYCFECKASYSPSLSKGNYTAIDDIQPKHTFVITPSNDSWSMKQGIDVISLSEIKDIQ